MITQPDERLKGGPHIVCTLENVVWLIFLHNGQWWWKFCIEFNDYNRGLTTLIAFHT